MFQKELKSAEYIAVFEPNEFETHRQVLQKQLQTETEHTAQLKAKIVNEDACLKRLIMQVADLKLQMTWLKLCWRMKWPQF